MSLIFDRDELNLSTQGARYKQIAKIISQNISSGNLNPDDKIPTEPELMELFECSRITIRAAIKELVDKGQLIRRQGLGTFVTKELKNLSVNDFAGFTDSWIRDGGAAVVNYESLSKIVGAIEQKLRLDMLVIDEAHYIKNPEAKRTQLIHSLDDESDRILMMTGTPLENKVEEMCELIGFVRPDMVKEIRENAGMRHVPAFREMPAPVYLRRQREMVLEELPPLTMEEEWCEMTPQDFEAYSEQVRDGVFMGMRRISFLQKDLKSSSKALRLTELCSQAMEEERKVIVFSYFRETIRKVKAFLGDIVLGTITGSTPVEERQLLIDRFTDVPGGAVLICQVQAGGTGLNIQAAGTVIFCEPQIKPSLTWQALSRVYRMGQVQNVLVYHLLCENTVDEAVMGILARKEAEFELFAQESAIADAADGIADKEWIRKLVEEERRKYLPVVAE